MKPFRLILNYARRYTLSLVLTAFSMLVLVAIQLLIPWIVKLLVTEVTAPGAGLGDMNYVSILAIVVLAAYLIRAGLTFVRSYVAHVAGWGVVADVREYIYEHMQRLSLRFYEDKQVGNLMSNVVNDTDLFEQLIAHAIPDVVVNLITLIGVTAVLLSLNSTLTLLSLIPIPFVIISLRVYAKYVRPAFRNRQKVLGDLNVLLNDNLSGIREIKAFTRENEEAQRVHEGIENYRKSQLGALKVDGNISTLRGIYLFAWDSDRNLFRRQAGIAGEASNRRPCGLLPVPAEFLCPRSKLERCLGSYPILACRG